MVCLFSGKTILPTRKPRRSTNWRTAGRNRLHKYVGGIYSSEWFWAKILRTLRVDESVRDHAFSWVEHCDWISAELTGITDPLRLKRSRCAAGHKALWHQDFDGLPSNEFFKSWIHCSTACATGFLPIPLLPTGQWAPFRKNGPKSWAYRRGGHRRRCFDAHMGAVGALIEPYSLCKVIGTSTCDMLVAPNEEVGHLLIKGICGQVDGSIVPGMLGMEAGQSAFGDIYAWFAKLVVEPVRTLLGRRSRQELSKKLIPHLAEQAAKLPVTEKDIIAVDWLNGRRTPMPIIHSKERSSALTWRVIPQNF
jgi:L-ribulokinase